MPRIYDSVSDPRDFCGRCFPKAEEAAFKRYGLFGDGPDDRGNCFEYNADHPPYDDCDYCCEVCNKLLTEADDMSDGNGLSGKTVEEMEAALG